VQALWLLSLLMRDHGLSKQALIPLREAMRLEPNRMDLQSSELLLMGFDENIPADQLFQLHVEFGTRLESVFVERFQGFSRCRKESHKLRVGYVSADFCVHPVALFLIPLLEGHSRENFKTYCYSSGLTVDHVTDRIRATCDQWVDARAMSDSQLAVAISADEIDILVDLGGHSSRPRLAVFAERPAPVQVSWLGYLNTTGLTRMDYRLCDERTDPVELFKALHTERLLHLPNSLWCYRPLLDADLRTQPPFEKNGYITFGSFNSALKISPAMCRRWAQLLMRLPDSRIRIANVDSERKKTEILQELTAAGVSCDRADFLQRVSLDQYLQLYYDVDISLDAFPYGGGTTTFDSLWMGVPVVTAVGSTSVSRSAASILGALGLQRWIAPCVEDYLRVAMECASDRASIRRLRASLRQAMQESALTDEARFAADMESAYRAMWQSVGRTDC
jgi:predicted O-linked N-acetylglucosamine transferase (SPINDLY family)